MTTVITDVTGLRPAHQLPGEARNLTPAQRQALLAEPLLAATARFCWQMGLHSTELTPDGALLCGRILRLAARACDELRDDMAAAPVLIQLLAGQIAVAAREIGRDLMRYNLRQTGGTGAVLPMSVDKLLLEAEAQDPALGIIGQTPACVSAAAAVAAAATAALTALQTGQTLATAETNALTPLYEDMVAAADLISVTTGAATLIFLGARLDTTFGRISAIMVGPYGTDIPPTDAAIATALTALDAVLAQTYLQVNLRWAALECLDRIQFGTATTG